MAGENSKKKSSKKGSFALGIIIILFALIGVGFAASLAVDAIKNFTNSDSQKSEYEKYLYPVVMLDPDVFDDVTNANMKDLLNASILSLLTDSESSPYDFDFVEGEVSGLAIPQKTVEKAFAALFGTDVTPVHQSVECSTCVFEYQSASQRYIIPLTGYDPAYSPRVIEIEKSREGAIVLTVGYIAYGDWEVNENKAFTETQPAKYRKITLRETGSSYYVSAIQSVDMTQFTTASTTIKTTSTTTAATTKPTNEQ